MHRYLALFRLPAYRRYWIGFTTSYLGDEVTRVAFIWFVYERTGSAEAIGWLLACLTAPILLGGLLAGWLLDRFERRAVLIGDSLIRAGLIALVPLLQASGVLALWHLYAIAALHGLLMMIPLAGTPTLIVSLVPAELRATANATEMLGFTSGAVIGPMLGGVLIGALGAPLTVLVDVATYLVFALCLWRMGRSRECRSPAGPTAFGFGGVLALLGGNAVLLATTSMFLVWNIGSGMIGVWLPVLVRERFDGGAALYGLLVGAQAAGQMLSALAIGALATSGRLGRQICFAQALSGVALLMLAVLGSTPLPVAVALVIFGICAAPLTIWAQTLRMQIVPPELRGRAFALMRMLMQGGRPLGGLLGGLAVPALGALGAAMLSAAIAGLPGLAGLLVRALRLATADDTARARS